MAKFFTAMFVVLALNSAASRAAESVKDAREIVERGMSAYVKKGAAAAMSEWVRGSFMEANPQAMSQANSLKQIEDFYGKPQGFDVVKETTITPRAKTLYFTINYQRGISFARLTAYRKADGTWVTTSFFFNTEAPQVFPPSLLGQ